MIYIYILISFIMESKWGNIEGFVYIKVLVFIQNNAFLLIINLLSKGMLLIEKFPIHQINIKNYTDTWRWWNNR